MVICPLTLSTPISNGSPHSFLVWVQVPEGGQNSDLGFATLVQPEDISFSDTDSKLSLFPIVLLLQWLTVSLDTAPALWGHRSAIRRSVLKSVSCSLLLIGEGSDFRSQFYMVTFFFADEFNHGWACCPNHHFSHRYLTEPALKGFFVVGSPFEFDSMACHYYCIYTTLKIHGDARWQGSIFLHVPGSVGLEKRVFSGPLSRSDSFMYDLMEYK